MAHLLTVVQLQVKFINRSSILDILAQSHKTSWYISPR